METETWNAIRKVKVRSNPLYEESKHQDRCCYLHRRDINPSLQRSEIPRSNLRSRFEIPCAHKPSSQERHSIWAGNRKHRKGQVGRTTPVFTTTLHLSHRSSDGLCCGNLAPPRRYEIPHDSATGQVLNCATSNYENDAGMLPHHIDRCTRERNDPPSTTPSPPRKDSQIRYPNAHAPPATPPASMDPTSPGPEMADATLPNKPRKHCQTFPRMHARP